MNRITNAIVTAGQSAAAWAVATQQRVERRATPTRQTKQLFGAFYALTFALVAIAPVAHAQQSFADSFNTAGETIDAGKVLAGKAGILFAIILVISSGLLMKKRSTEGQTSQVKTGAIVGCLIAAVVCGGAGAILYRAGASVGLQTSDYGSLPN
jgi:hypothetical protein